MPSHGLRIALTIIGILLSGSMAAAQGAATARECASIADDPARLACYDAAFGRPGGQAGPSTTAVPAPAPAPAAGVATATATAAKAREEFGLTEVEKQARDPAKAEAQSESITGRVAGLGYRPTGELIVTLDDGQVWHQIESGRSVVLKPGDEVTIRKASLGSYLLVTPKRIAVRVRRIK